MEIHEAIEALQRTGGRPSDMQEDELLLRLRAGDEDAFCALIERLGPSMLRVARLYVRESHVAEEVVQETWLNVLRGLERFEGRSSLRTWILTILANCARRRAERESRYVATAELESDAGLAIDSRFFPDSHPRWAGMWTTRVDDWQTIPEDRLLASEGRRALGCALEELPATQAIVFVLRDVEGWDSRAVCEVLRVSAANQRVLLHRARTHIRDRMVGYLAEEAP